MTDRVKEFYDKDSGTFTYLVVCQKTKETMVVDPVWNYDSTKDSFSEKSFEEICEYIESHGLTPKIVYETHVHADHITASELFKKKYKTSTYIHKEVETVCSHFGVTFNSGDFDRYLKDGDTFQVGILNCEVIHTPGHTPACASLLVGSHLFAGDSLFMPDFGTGRCDFPGGSAASLYDSVQKLYSLPDATKVFVGHDYGPGGREVCSETSILDSKRSNKHINEHTTKEAFQKMRTERDQTLNEPKLLKISMKYNLNGGKSGLHA